MKVEREYLLDILDEISRIEAFMPENYAAFVVDEKSQYAVMRAYARIGEIAKRLPLEWLDAQPQAEWKSVKAFRDILIHRYDEIIPSIVWQALQKLPILKTATEDLVNNLTD